MRARATIAFLLLLVTACYDPAHQACRISCGAGSVCPDDTSCQSDGWCHPGGDTTVCSESPPPDTLPDTSAPPADTTQPPADTAACPAGYGIPGPEGHLYHWHGMDERDWLEAEQLCEAEGTHLVVIDSAAEDDHVRNVVTTGPHRDTWFGLTDRKTEGTFLRVTGGAPVYTRWVSPNPDDFGTGEDCVGISATGDWNDVDCDIWIGDVVCECDGLPVDPTTY